jgi:hypothetical protein
MALVSPKKPLVVSKGLRKLHRTVKYVLDPRGIFESREVYLMQFQLMA